MVMNKDPFESLDQIAAETAASLSQAAANSAFRLFKEAQFRRLARFEHLSQTEQDRVFNELVLAYLVLIMLMFEAPDLRIPRESRDYLAGVKEKIPKAYLDSLGKLGIEAEHIRDWEKLISMRYEEYARDRHDVRAAAMEIESSERPLDPEGLSRIQMLVPVQAVAIGCHRHICRGKTQGQDDLFKCMLTSLSRFYVEFRVRIEGGKITPLTRARAAVKRALHRKGKGKRR
jgi:hypothetical protein